jgi:hypothetical protein
MTYEMTKVLSSTFQVILYFVDKCDITLVPSTPSCEVEKPPAPSINTLVDLVRQIHSTCTSKGFLVEKGGGKCSVSHGWEFSYFYAQLSLYLYEKVSKTAC